MPGFLSKTAIAQRQMQLESLCTGGRNLPRLHGLTWFREQSGHGSLRRSWIEDFAHLASQVAEVEGFLQQAHPGVQHAVVSDHVFRVTGHVENFHVRTNFRNSLR